MSQVLKYVCLTCDATYDKEPKLCTNTIHFLTCDVCKGKVAYTNLSGWKPGNVCPQVRQSSCKQGVLRDLGHTGSCPGRMTQKSVEVEGEEDHA